jgi:hypothetical protein
MAFKSKKFRCIERAIVKVKDADSFSKLNRIETVSTTYFDVETNVWGIEPSGKLVFGLDLCMQKLVIHLFT